jgi:hypothetical protein
MPIRIKCPSCQTILGVKETLAGKKAKCPKCQFMLTIPMPKAAAAAPAVSVEDAEALAASAFADEPAPAAPPPSTQVIEFECPFCMEMVKVSGDLAGKQTPCPNPECKRIVKVPLPKEDGKPKDWRQVSKRGPSGALKKNEDEPEGAWTTAQKTRVSTEALEEAGALPVKKEPVSAAQWLRRGVLAFVALIVCGGAAWGISAWLANKRLYGTLNNALEAADRAKPKPAQQAAVFRGAGEFYVNVKQAPKAMEYFGKSRGAFGGPVDDKAPADLERDTVLTELALAMVELGGNDNEVRDKYRLDWDDVTKSIRQTLLMLSCDESKQAAMREVGRKLLAHDQQGAAIQLTSELAAAAAQKQAPAETQDGQPGDDNGEGAKKPDAKKDKARAGPVPRLAAQRVGLLLALKDTKAATDVLAAPSRKEKELTIEDPVVRLVYAEGRAREGNFSEAQKIARAKPDGADTALDRLEASLAVAAVALGEKANAEARSNLDDALKILHGKDLKKDERAKKPALLLQAARLAARLDLRDEVKKIAALMPDRATKSLALLELVTVQLETSSSPVPAAVVEEAGMDKESLAYGLALEKVARHNTRLGQRSDALALGDDADDRLKAFVYVGVAQGMSDPRK